MYQCEFFFSGYSKSGKITLFSNVGAAATSRVAGDYGTGGHGAFNG